MATAIVKLVLRVLLAVPATIGFLALIPIVWALSNDSRHTLRDEWRLTWEGYWRVPGLRNPGKDDGGR